MVVHAHQDDIRVEA